MRTPCAIEGDKKAAEILSELFRIIGGEIFTIETKDKLQYHAGLVLVSNYLTALLEAGIQTFAQVGFRQDDALKLIEPLVRSAVNNTFKIGPVHALTGPIARGDFKIVNSELLLLKEWKLDIAEVYRALGKIALELSTSQGSADSNKLSELDRILK